MSRAGTFRHKLIIERNAATTVNRQKVDNWAEFIPRKGRIIPVKADERQQADAQQEVLITHRIRLRWDTKTSQITDGDRAKYLPGFSRPARYFAILSAIDPDETRREIELEVIERTFEPTGDPA